MNFHLKENDGYGVIKIEYILAIVCFLSNISQLPSLYESGIGKKLVFIAWFILLGYTILNYPVKINIFNIVLFVLIFDLFVFVCALFVNSNYLNSPFLYPLNVSMFVLFVSYFAGQIVSKNAIIKICRYYVISALIVALNLYFETFKGTDWANTIGYLYAAKNSAAQIMLIGIVIILMFKLSKLNIFNWIAIFFLGTMLLMLKSRASLVGLVLAIGYYVFFTIEKRKRKMLSICAFMVGIIFLFMNDATYNLIVNNVMLNNMSGSNLNEISSGRIGHLEIFKLIFPSHMLIGNGGMYLESFPLSALASYGILGASILFGIALMPIYICLKDRNAVEGKQLRYFIIILSIVMISNGIFEQLSPFGPGIKCYILWLATGLYLGQRVKWFGGEG